MKRLRILLPLLCFVLFIAFSAGSRPVAGEAASSEAGAGEAGGLQKADKLVYADFETAKDNRPVSSRGGPVQLFNYQESTPCRFKGASDSNAPELVRLSKDDPNHAVAFDYWLAAPNGWASVGVEVQGQPDVDGKTVADDVTGYKFLTLQLMITGLQTVNVEFASRGQGVGLKDASPSTNFRASKGFNTYKVALNTLRYPSYLQVSMDPKEILKKLTSVKIVVSCGPCQPINGTVVIDNLVFQN